MVLTPGKAFPSYGNCWKPNSISNLYSPGASVIVIPGAICWTWIDSGTLGKSTARHNKGSRLQNMWIPSKNTDGLESIPMQRFSRASKPWMSELHRPLKQVDDDCLIACHLIFLYSGQEVYLLAKGRVLPPGLRHPQSIQVSDSTQRLLSQWLMSR